MTRHLQGTGQRQQNMLGQPQGAHTQSRSNRSVSTPAGSVRENWNGLAGPQHWRVQQAVSSFR